MIRPLGVRSFGQYLNKYVGVVNFGGYDYIKFRRFSELFILIRIAFSMGSSLQPRISSKIASLESSLLEKFLF